MTFWSHISNVTEKVLLSSEMEKIEFAILKIKLNFLHLKFVVDEHCKKKEFS
jgi:hypothetical protein